MGACWLACHLYWALGLEAFWEARLPDSREGTRWWHILQTLVCYRLIDPDSEWRLHRHWYAQSAMGNLLGADDGLVEKNALYRCLNQLLAHQTALFFHLTARWQDLFGARFEVLLYDLASTYFESEPPSDPQDKRRYGYSRNKRPDCVQVVMALLVTPEGFPLAYEVLPGNTADNTEQKSMPASISSDTSAASCRTPDGMRCRFPAARCLAAVSIALTSRDPCIERVRVSVGGCYPAPFSRSHRSMISW